MKQLFLFVLGVASLSACNKDSENPSFDTELLTSRNWRLTAFSTTITSPGSNPATMDNYAAMAACRKDDFRKFNTDKTITVDEGPTLCIASSPQITTLRWDFKSDQQQLLVTPRGATYPIVYDLVELSASTMRLRQTDINTGGTTTITSVSDVTYTSF